MSYLNTDPVLLDKLRRLSARKMSSEKIERHRLSCALGAMRSNWDISVEQFKLILDRHHGRV